MLSYDIKLSPILMYIQNSLSCVTVTMLAAGNENFRLNHQSGGKNKPIKSQMKIIEMKLLLMLSTLKQQVSE